MVPIANDEPNYCPTCRTLRRFDAPINLQGDRHGVLVSNNAHWTVEEQLAGRRKPTQFGCNREEFGVPYTATQSPQAKGRIGPHRFSLAGAKVQLHELFDGQVTNYYGDTELHISGG